MAIAVDSVRIVRQRMNKRSICGDRQGGQGCQRKKPGAVFTPQMKRARPYRLLIEDHILKQQEAWAAFQKLPCAIPLPGVGLIAQERSLIGYQVLSPERRGKRCDQKQAARNLCSQRAQLCQWIPSEPRGNSRGGADRRDRGGGLHNGLPLLVLSDRFFRNDNHIARM